MIFNLRIILIIVFCGNINTIHLNYHNNHELYRENIVSGGINYSPERLSKRSVKLRNETKCISCKKSRYRTIDGSCNNLRNPTWGTPNSPYDRLVPYKYGDGVHSFLLSKTLLRPLPSARNIRLKILPTKLVIDENYTLITMQWGQIVTHDLSNTSPVKVRAAACCDPRRKSDKRADSRPICESLDMSHNDPVYGLEGKICMNFLRTRSTEDNNCTTRGIPTQALTSTTSYMDLSLVYGSSEKVAAQIRARFGGQLLNGQSKGQEVLPTDPKLSSNCQRTLNSTCYLAGDGRVNQNPELALVQVLLLREHNRIARSLNRINPHWNDETIFQETRRILIAIYQHITYYEYLPIVIGFENMAKNKLTYVKPTESGYVNDYNPNKNPAVYDEHASAAFRVFHSTIRGYLQEYQEKRKLVSETRLSDSYNNPFVITVEDNFDNLARGLTTQLQARCDQYYDEEVTDYLFRGINKNGLDLPAIDIFRARDHNLPSYVDTRAACGLSVPKTFKDMRDYISTENVRKLEEIYKNIEDVELMVAGPLEFQDPNALTGPTFVCIITKQFYKTRVSDRYFYENGADSEIAFSRDQLKSIRQSASLARLFCDNVASIKSMQSKAFNRVSRRNKLMSCKRLPAVDLTLWKEQNEK